MRKVNKYDYENMIHEFQANEKMDEQQKKIVRNTLLKVFLFKSLKNTKNKTKSGRRP